MQLETAGLLAALIQARLYLALCERGLEQRGGIHRLSIQAQRFVFDRWYAAMNRDGIDVCNVFGYHPAVLRAARQQLWFNRNTQPHPDDAYEPIAKLEEIMPRLLERGRTSGKRMLTNAGGVID